MTKNLTINDYKRVLEYYKISLPMTNSLIKNAAEQILANKLCRCIKKVDKNNEKRAIGVCTKTIFNRKGYTRGKFKCKGSPTVNLRKNVKNVTIKRRK
jgi:hypothetical protein